MSTEACSRGTLQNGCFKKWFTSGQTDTLIPFLIKPSLSGTGEMAQWLDALATLPVGLGLIPSTNMAAYNGLELQF